MSGAEKRETLGRRRSLARLRGVQAIYQWHITRAPASSIIEEFLCRPTREGGSLADGFDGARFDAPHFERLVRGVLENRQDLQRIVGRHIGEGWTIERIDLILAAILYAGSYELTHSRDIPPKVIINEYINIAHAFFGDENIPRVVNGALDALSKGALRRDQEDKTG